MWNGLDALGPRFRDSEGMTTNQPKPRALISAIRQTEAMLRDCFASLIKHKTKEAHTERARGHVATAAALEREIGLLRVELAARTVARQARE